MKRRGLLFCTAVGIAALVSSCVLRTNPTAPDTCSLRVINNSSHTITYVYMSTSYGYLGTDKLGMATVSAGSSYTITGISADYYYLTAVRGSMDDTAYLSGVTLSAGQTYTWTLTESDFSSVQPATIHVVNNSSYSIGYVYMSTSSSSLGTDKLGASVISVGSSYNITGITPGYYYIKAVRMTMHDTASLSGVTLSAGQTYNWTLTDASFATQTATSIKIVNKLVCNVTVNLNGVFLDTIYALDSMTYTRYIDSLRIDWNLVRVKTSTGAPIGDAMGSFWSTIYSPATSERFEIDNVIGTDYYFCPYITNQASKPVLMAVNWGLTSENRCNCTIPANTANVRLGYYHLYTNTQLRGYPDGSNYTGTSYIYWDYANFSSLVLSGSGRTDLNITPASVTW